MTIEIATSVGGVCANLATMEKEDIFQIVNWGLYLLEREDTGKAGKA